MAIWDEMPTTDSITSQGDRIAELLRNSAGGYQPSQGDNFNAMSRAYAESYRVGGDPSKVYSDSLDKARQNYREDTQDMISGEKDIYNILVKAKEMGDANDKAAVDAMLNITKDPAKLQKLMAAMHSDPEEIGVGNAVTKAYAHAAELGIEPDDAWRAPLEKRKMEAEIRRLNAEDQSGGLTPYQAAMIDASNRRLNIAEQLANYKMTQNSASSKVAVPGFDIQPGIVPSHADSQALKGAKQAQGIISTQLEKLKKLVGAKGSEFAFGGSQREMAQISKQIMLNLKELENLGVLNGPDVQVLAESFLDPTSVGAQFRSNSTILKSYDDFSDYLNTRVMETAKARGYVPSGALPPPDEDLQSIDAELQEIDRLLNAP